MSAKVVQLILVDSEHLIGNGKDSPYRRTWSLHTLSGERLVEVDPYGTDGQAVLVACSDSTRQTLVDPE